jgi:GR25 family glycosyltransferase involved in LPS biosynthesis
MIPIVITQRGSKRIDFVTESLKKAGIERFRFFYGLNGAKSGLVATIKYGEDNPQNPESIGPKHIGCTMSHIMLWTALEMDESGADYWMIFEDDIVLRDGWREKVEQALRDVPNDWDILFAGSCCANGRVEEKIAENLFRCHPLCTHAYLVRRKALKPLLETNTEIYAPIDLQIYFKTRHLLNSYSILPRVADQFETEIPD